MSALLIGRKFQLWEYSVSHGSLLIRSPKNNKNKINIDVKFFGIEYISAPRHLGEFQLASPSDNELQKLISILKKDLSPNNVYVLKSKAYRHLIVASKVKIEENKSEIFDSPFVE